MQVLFLEEATNYTSAALDAHVGYSPALGWKLSTLDGDLLRYLHRDEARDLVFNPANGFTGFDALWEPEDGRARWT